MAKIGEIEVGLSAGLSVGKEIGSQHKLQVSFPESSSYNSQGANYDLVHDILPAFLSAMMGKLSFLTSLTSWTDQGLVEIFDGRHPTMSWHDDPDYWNSLVPGRGRTIEHWPKVLPVWTKNYEAIEKLCRAYVQIIPDGSGGCLEEENLVHLFFGIESFHKARCNFKSGSLGKALEYTIGRINSYFQDVEKYVSVAKSIDLESLSHARQVLVHANEGKPDYRLVYNELIFIARSVLLMEMEYPIAHVQQETQHWDLWHFFAKRRNADESNN